MRIEWTTPKSKSYRRTMIINTIECVNLYVKLYTSSFKYIIAAFCMRDVTVYKFCM